MNKLLLFMLSVTLMVNHKTGAITSISMSYIVRNIAKKVVINASKADILYQNLLNCNSRYTTQNLINAVDKDVLSSCVTKIADNIEKFNSDVLIEIMNEYKETEKIFQEKMAERIDKVSAYTLYKIMNRNPKTIEIFTQKVLENFNKISSLVIDEILIHNPNAIAAFTQKALKNFDQIDSCILEVIMKHNRDNEVIIEIFTQMALENFNKMSPRFLENILDYNPNAVNLFVSKIMENFDKAAPELLLKIISIKPETAKIFESKAIEHIDKVDSKVIDKIIQIYPESLEKFKKKLSGLFEKDTQTYSHMKLHQNEILNYLMSHIIYIPFIKNVLSNEKKLNDEGRFVLYHGMSKEVDFLSQIYTKLWETVHKKKLSDEFRFLRFCNSNGEILDNNTKKFISEPQSESNLREKILDEVTQRDKVECWRIRLLFANAFLFGNLDVNTKDGDCTIRYVLENVSINTPKISLKELFSCFNISNKIYNKYKDRLEKLSELNKKIGMGRLLQIGLTKDQLCACVYTSHSGSGSARDIKIQGLGEVDSNKSGALILETVKRVPEAIEEEEDWIYCAILTSDIILNKDSGIKMRFYHTGDENEWRSYIKQRDELFEEIARDIEMEKKSRKGWFAKIATSTP